MKRHVSRPRRTWIIAGEEIGGRELAEILVCGTALAVGGWLWVVAMVAMLTPEVGR